MFVLRLEDGDRLPDTIERFAKDHGVESAMVIFLGGTRDGSRVVVGPEDGDARPVVPMIHRLAGIREAAGVGTLFLNEAGDPILHLHAAAGRGGDGIVGCTRAGVDIWLVGEVVIQEIVGVITKRVKDANGFELLRTVDPGESPA